MQAVYSKFHISGFKRNAQCRGKGDSCGDQSYWSIREPWRCTASKAKQTAQPAHVQRMTNENNRGTSLPLLFKYSQRSMQAFPDKEATDVLICYRWSLETKSTVQRPMSRDHTFMWRKLHQMPSQTALRNLKQQRQLALMGYWHSQYNASCANAPIRVQELYSNASLKTHVPPFTVCLHTMVTLDSQMRADISQIQIRYMQVI